LYSTREKNPNPFAENSANSRLFSPEVVYLRRSIQAWVRR
jgi:hypothetical protein